MLLHEFWPKSWLHGSRLRIAICKRTWTIRFHIFLTSVLIRLIQLYNISYILSFYSMSTKLNNLIIFLFFLYFLPMPQIWASFIVFQCISNLGSCVTWFRSSCASTGKIQRQIRFESSLSLQDSYARSAIINNCYLLLLAHYNVFIYIF